MKLLIDTHIFIWWDDNAAALSGTASNALTNPANVIYLSMASIWEMQIKSNLGKLQFDLSIDQKVTSQRKRNNLMVLPITEQHIYELSNLGTHHRDPFDRLVVAQARVEALTIVTADPKIGLYAVKTLW